MQKIEMLLEEFMSIPEEFPSKHLRKIGQKKRVSVQGSYIFLFQGDTCGMYLEVVSNLEIATRTCKII